MRSTHTQGVTARTPRRARADGWRAGLKTLLITGSLCWGMTCLRADDLAEANASSWTGFGDGAFTLSDESAPELVRSGATSIKFETLSGFDTGVKYPASADAHWDLTGVTHFEFWSYAENPHSFQDQQPVLVLKQDDFNYFRYTPALTITRELAWQFFQIPLAGSPAWNREQVGSPDLAQINQLEIHQDTWDYGFTIWYDAVQFSSPLLPAPQVFGLTLPAEITPGSLGGNAGVISQAGEVDRYTFTGTAGQQIYIEALSGSANLRWTLMPQSAPNWRLFITTLNDTCWPRLIQLPYDDNYLLQVEQVEPVAPLVPLEYSFSLNSVPADQYFFLSLGGFVAANFPDFGAGNIEVRGARDHYSVTVEANTSIYISDWSGGGAGFRLMIHRDSDGQYIAEDWLDGIDPGSVLLSEAGSYTLTVDGGDCTTHTGTYSFAVDTAPAPQEFGPIDFDTVVGPDYPAPGPRQLDTLGAMDVYTFEITADMPKPVRLYFDDLTASDHGLRWRVQSPYGWYVFSDDRLDGCDPGVRDFWDNGIYTVAVYWAGDSAPGGYSFVISTVPAEAYQTFALNLGDTVPDDTGAGSGVLETVASRDNYVLTLLNETRVYVEDKTDSWRGHAMVISRRGGGFWTWDNLDGSDQGVQLMPAGTYDITVFSSCSAEAGAYSFRLWEAPAPQEFAITKDTTVPGGLGAGAGEIGVPGEVDVYTFTMAAPGPLYVENLTVGGAGLRWRMLNPAGWWYFERSMDSGDPGSFYLGNAGTYKIVVQASGDPVTGMYAFKLHGTPATPQEFDLTLPATVSEGSHGAGSGTVEEIFGSDLYRFTVAPGTLVDFADLTTTDNGFWWRLRDPDGQELFVEDLRNDWSPGRRFLAKGGQYTIEVVPRPWLPGARGVYSFSITEVAAGRFVLDAAPYSVAENLVNGAAAAGAGSIEAVGGVDIYQLTTAADTTLLFRDLNTFRSPAPRWRLFDPTGRELFGSSLDGYPEWRYRIPAGQTYWIVVDAWPWGGVWSSWTGTYAFDLVPCPDPTVFSIAIGDSVSPGQPATPEGAGTIGNALESDVYTFAGLAGQRIYVKDTSTGWNGLKLRLSDPNGNWLIWADPLDNCGIDAVTLGTDGDYRIEVGSDRVDPADVGDYGFTVYAVPPVETYALVPGEIQTGTISVPGAQHDYTFTAAGGDQFAFADLTPGYSGLWAELIDPNGNTVFSEYFDGWTDNPTPLLTVDGTYTLRIQLNDCSLTSGSYAFRLSTLLYQYFNLTGFPVQIPEDLGDPSAGAIEIPGAVDIYSFDAIAGQVLVLCDRTAGSVGLQWRLWSPSLSLLASGDLVSGNTASIALIETGSYRIEVGASPWAPDATGSYAFSLAPAQERNFAAALGDVVSGATTSFADRDVYTFEAAAGDVVYFDDQSPVWNGLYWTLTDPDGNQLFWDWLDAGDPGHFTLPTTGSYRLTVEGAGGCSSGTYGFALSLPLQQQFTLDLATSPQVPDADPGTGDGQIETSGAKDVFAFDVAAPTVVAFDDLTASYTDLAWRLVDPDGVQLFYDQLDGASPDNRLLVKTGTYHIEVAGIYWDTGSVGSYSFRLRAAPSETFALTLGSSVPDADAGTGDGNIEVAGGADIYSFTPASDTMVYPQDLTPQHTPYFRWRMYNAAGTLLFDSDLHFSGEHLIAVTGGQTYWIAVNAYVWGGSWTTLTGTYAFKLWEAPAPGGPYPFAIGDTVAGNLPADLARNVHSFSTTGGSVYFDELSAPSGVYWRLKKSTGTVYFDQLMDNCDPTSAVLPAGDYTVEVYAATPGSTGAYSFKLWAVPAAQTFSLALGDVVPRPAPGVGEGSIEAMGGMDVYSLNVPVPTTVYLEDRTSDYHHLVLLLYKANGDYVTSDYLDGTDAGLISLPAGDYTLTVRAGDCYASPGDYSFALIVPPTQTFDLALDQLVADGTVGGAPVAGAGNLAVKGERDVYTFTAVPGQAVYMQDLSGTSVSGCGRPSWTLYGPDGATIKSDNLDGSDVGRIVLPTGPASPANYTIVVKYCCNCESPVGTYSFKLYDVPTPVTYPIVAGVAVTEGAPAAGAGILTIPGEQDLYTFTATAGEKVYFKTYGAAAPMIWTLNRPDATEVFSVRLDGSDPGQKVLSQTGTYTLTVKASGNTVLNLGTYGFLLIGEAPLLVGSPEDVTAFAGDSATLAVSATSTATLGYQWYHDGVLKVGATSATLTLSNLTDADAGEYTVEVSTAKGTVTAGPATVTVLHHPYPLPAITGDGVVVEVFNSIGGGVAPQPSDLRWRTPSGTTLSPSIDFPHPGSIVNVGNSFNAFFADTTTPPVQITGLQAHNFILRIKFYLKVTEAMDLNASNPGIDVKLAVASDDGFQLYLGTRLLGQAGDRGFTQSTMDVNVSEAGLWPVTLLYAANATGQSGLEFRWQTATSGGMVVVPQAMMYQTADLADQLVTFEEVPGNTAVTDQYRDKGLLLNTIAGDLKTTDASPAKFVPVSPTHVYGDPNSNPAATGEVEMTFVEPGTAIAAATSYLSFFVIDAEGTGATVQAFDPADTMIFNQTYHGGGANQERVSIRADQIVRVRVTLGTGSDTVAIDNIAFATPHQINHAPVIGTLDDLTSPEGTMISFNVPVTENDAGQTVSYFLVGTVPSGVTLNPATGAFQWTPSEVQGPGDYAITVRVFDDAFSPKSDTRTFTIHVTEVNAAPQISTISNRRVNSLTPVQVQASASDGDLPAQSLTYSLDAGAPEGTAINPSTGLLTWTPPAGTPDGTYHFGVVVTDNGSPEKSVSTAFDITLDQTPPTVVSITPGGTVTTAWSYFTVTFSEAIDSGHLQTAGTTLTGPAGTVAASSISAESTTAVRVYFPPQYDNGTYQMALAPTAARDLAGNYIDGDSDGTGGEATEDVVTANVALNIPGFIGYHNLGWRYRQVTQGGLEGFESGDEPEGFVDGKAAFGTGTGCPLDPTIRTAWSLGTDMLLRRTVSLPQGAEGVHVGIAIDNDVQVWWNGVDISGGLQTSGGCAVIDRFVFDVPNHLIVKGDNLLAIRARDRGGEAYVDARVTIDDLNPPARPDLVIQDIAVPATANAGESVQITWKDANVGPGAATAPWSVQVYLTSNADGSGGSLVKTVAVADNLAAGATAARSASFTLPAGSGGDRYFRLVIDSAPQVTEFNEVNNTAVSGTALSVKVPDLIVSGVSAPPTAQFGATIAVSYTVENVGTRSVTEAWNDQILLSSDNAVGGDTVLQNRPSGDASPLAAAGATTLTVNVTMPATGTEGTFYLYARTDTTGQVTESNESNNTSPLAAIALTQPPRGDLVVEDLTVPATATPGVPFTVSWKTRNTGAVDLTGTWVETVALSTDDTIGSDVVHASVNFAGTLAAGAAVDRSAQVTIPVDGLAGALRAVVTTDVGGAITEASEVNNAAISAGSIAVPLQLRLAADAAQVNENAAALGFTLTRNGSRTSALTVTLVSDDTTELEVPATVEVPAGQASVRFNGTPKNDGIADGDQVVGVAASATAYAGVSVTVTVKDVNFPVLTLTLPASVGEGATANASVKRDSAPATPLVVNLVSSNPSQLAVPANVVIPAGSDSVSFLVSGVEDTLIESDLSYTVSASAASAVGDSKTLKVADNDLPVVTLAVAPASVSEGAGVNAATATLTRSLVSDRALTIGLTSSDTTKLVVPASINIPANEASISFPVAAVDNAIVDGETVVTIQPVIMVGGNTMGNGTPATVTVTDNDGPTLTLKLAPKVVAEGVTGASTATLSRNTSTTDALEVQLDIDLATELAGPATVTIPAGKSSVTFKLDSLDDGVTDGNKTVKVTAAADGFTSGSDSLVVTDSNLPDLQVRFTDVPGSGGSEEIKQVTYRVENKGTAPTGTGKSFVQRLYLSTDQTVGNDKFLGQYIFPDNVPAGQFFDVVQSFYLPRNPGQYWLIATTDEDKAITEILEDNNTTISTPIEVSPTYHATVEVGLPVDPVEGKKIALAGTSVPLTGTALKSNGQPVPFALVNIHVNLRGTLRVFSALCNDQGKYSTTFKPLAGEAGIYAVGADHPGVATTDAQDGFTLIGMKATPSPASLEVVEGADASTTITVENLGDVALSGLTVTPNSNLPNVPNANVTLAFNDPTTLPALGSRTLTCQVHANDASYVSGTILLTVLTVDGASLTIPVAVKVVDLRPVLAPTPTKLVAAMKPDVQTLVELKLRNNGGEATGPLDVLLPPLSWLSATSTKLASIAPGGETSLMLLLKPKSTDGLVPGTPYTGTIGVGNAGYGMTVPFEFRYVTDGKGDLWVVVEDEYTYYAEGSPRVAGAQVTVRDAYTGDQVATGVADAGGVARFTDLPESYYRVEVSAEKHSSYSEVHFIHAAQVNSVVAFLYRQTVEYNWTVVPTEIEDRTKITIETTFETFVPVPVVTIDPPFIDLAQYPLPSQQILMTVKNTGLIAAQGAKLTFSSHPWYKITPLVEDVGLVPAMGEVKIPVTIENHAPAGGGGGVALADANRSNVRPAGGVPCTITAGLDWYLICGPDKKWHRVPVPVLNVEGDCPTLGFGWSWGGWGGPSGASGPSGPSSSYSPPVSFGPPVSCDPCDPEKFEKQDILTVDVSSFFKPIGAAVEAAITAATEGLLQPSVDISVNGGARTCCLPDGSQGIEVFGHAGGSLEVAVGPGISKEASLSVDVPPKGEASLSGEIKLGLQATGSLSLEGEVSSGCNFSGLEVSASGQVALRFFGGVEGELKASYSNPLYSADADVAAVNGSINGGVRIDFDYHDGTFTMTPCSEGIYYSAYAKLLGNTYSLFTDASGAPIEKVYLIDPTCPDGGMLMNLVQSQVIPGVEEAIRAAIARQLGPNAAKELHAKSAGTPIRFSSQSRLTTQSKPVVLGGNRRAGGARLQGSDGVCAKVKLRLEQEAVLTRNAFNATLEVVNNDSVPLESVSVDLNITDTEYKNQLDVFAIKPPALSGLSAVDGTGVINGGSKGSASWILIPTRDAAPESSVVYLVAGTLKYVQDGRQIVVPLQPVPITVYPDPLLYVKYFHQRDVYSDDPFTPEIEPTIPYALAVMAENRGKGTAKNFRITSAQPKIVENEKGLLIDFQIIATQVENDPLSPSLTVSLGDIPPSQTKIGRWLLTSTLQGLFIDYKVTFEHLDAIAGKKTALIDDVTIHEMIHMVSAPDPFDDGRPDFLVNDQPDPPTDLPDRVYLSDGRTNSVSVVTLADVEGAPNAVHPEVTMTAELPPGFVYLRVPEPSNGQMKLYGVKQGARVILMDVDNTTGIGNAWVTDRTFIGEGKRPVNENILHLFDYNPAAATGPVTYTLIYQELPPLDTSAPASAVKSLPAQSPATFAVTWEGSDTGGSGIANYDVYVSENGGPFTALLSATPLTGTMFTGSLGKTYTFYSQARDLAGNLEPAPAAADATTTVGDTDAFLTAAPQMSAIGDQTTAKDHPVLGVAFSLSYYDDTKLDTLRVTVESSNQTLLPPENVVIHGTGADRTFDLTPATGRFGEADVTLTVSDGSASSSRSFHLTVTPANDPPVAGDDLVQRPAGRSVKVAASQLLANDTDPEFDPLSIVAVASMSDRGAHIRLAGGWVYYEPTAATGNEADQFTYTVSDGRGGTAQGLVVVRTAGDAVNTSTQLDLTVGEHGEIILKFVGIPNRHYAIQRTTSAIGLSWLTLDTVQAGPTGLIEYADKNPPGGEAYYRAVDMTAP